MLISCDENKLNTNSEQKIKNSVSIFQKENQINGEIHFSNIEFPLWNKRAGEWIIREWVFPFVSFSEEFSTHRYDPCDSVLVRIYMCLLYCIVKFIGKYFQVKIVSIQTVNDSHIAHDFHFGILKFYLSFVWFDYVDCSDHTKTRCWELRTIYLNNFQCLIVS